MTHGNSASIARESVPRNAPAAMSKSSMVQMARAMRVTIAHRILGGAARSNQISGFGRSSPRTRRATGGFDEKPEAEASERAWSGVLRGFLSASGSFQRRTVPLSEVGCGFIGAEQVTHQVVIR
jgi:hypothetical protein